MPWQPEQHGPTWRVTPDMLGILTSEGRFAATNPAWFRTLGYTAEEVESRPFYDFVHPDDMARTEQAFHKVQQGKPVLQFENRYRHKNGSWRWLSWNAVPDDGRYFCNARDVTDMKRDRSDLRSREEEARLREQFIAVLGHDLRNPLAALGSAMALLGKEDLSPRGDQVVREAGRSIDRMQSLIDDLMDFAQARLGGGFSIEAGPTDALEPALRTVVEELAIAHPDIAIETDLRIDTPIVCDPHRIAQLTSNLLANAITHGNTEAPIELIAEGGGEALRLSVCNAGDPIPPVAMKDLFTPFFRGQASPSKHGLGLGLFICSEIAKAHGGRLSVESGRERTCFTFAMEAAAN